MIVPGRAGQYISTTDGYRTFIPKGLPPDPPVQMNTDQVRLLEKTGLALGRLDRLSTDVPNIGLFVSMYIKREALLSSEIEGTQSTLEDLLEYEAGDMSRESARDVLDYVRAMDYALHRLKTLPLSIKLILETHEILMSGARGGSKNLGQFRTGQVVVGGKYYPPPADRIGDMLEDLQTFMISDERYPDLVHCAIVHAQLETIHPFNDGNGRIGRLLISLLLNVRKMISEPLLYLSHYFLENRAEYYSRLMAVRDDGDWESWLSFFLTGVNEVSEDASRIAGRVFELRASAITQQTACPSQS